MADVTRQEHERRAQEGVEQLGEAVTATDAAIDDAAEAAVEDVQSTVEDAAETIAEAVEEVNAAVQEAAEDAADATPGADPDVDVDDIADRVWNRLEERIKGLTAPAAEVVEEAGDVAEPVLDSTGDFARDTAAPVSEHFWYRPRRLPFMRKGGN